MASIGGLHIPITADTTDFTRALQNVVSASTVTGSAIDSHLNTALRNMSSAAQAGIPASAALAASQRNVEAALTRVNTAQSAVNTAQETLNSLQASGVTSAAMLAPYVAAVASAQAAYNTELENALPAINALNDESERTVALEQTLSAIRSRAVNGMQDYSDSVARLNELFQMGVITAGQYRTALLEQRAVIARSVGMYSTMITLPVVAFFSACAYAATDYTKTLKQVQAQMGDFSKTALIDERVTSLAIAYGRDMNEVAETLQVVQSQGISTGAALKTLDTVMAYSAVTGQNTDQAAASLIGTLQDMQLIAGKTDDEIAGMARELGNTYMNAAKAANGTTQQFADAMSQAGKTARTLGISVNQAMSAIMLFQQQGLAKGGEAGRMFTDVMNELNTSVYANRRVWLELVGIDPIDALTGGMKDFDTLTKSLSQQFAGLSVEEQKYKLNLLGVSAAQAQAVLSLAESGDALDANRRALEGNNDGLQRTAEVLREDFIFQLNIMKTQLQSIAVQIGQDLIPVIMEVAAVVRGWLAYWNELSPTFKRFIIVGGVVVVAIGGVVTALAAIVSIAPAVMAAIGGIAVALQMSVPVIGWIAAGITAIGVAAGAFALWKTGAGEATATMDRMRQSVDAVTASEKALNDAAAKNRKGMFSTAEMSHNLRAEVYKLNVELEKTVDLMGKRSWESDLWDIENKYITENVKALEREQAQRSILQAQLRTAGDEERRQIEQKTSNYDKQIAALEKVIASGEAELVQLRKKKWLEDSMQKTVESNKAVNEIKIMAYELQNGEQAASRLRKQLEHISPEAAKIAMKFEQIKKSMEGENSARETVKNLREEVQIMGLTADAAEIMKLRMKGVSEETLNLMRNGQGLKQFYTAMEDLRTSALDLNREFGHDQLILDYQEDLKKVEKQLQMGLISQDEYTKKVISLRGALEDKFAVKVEWEGMSEWDATSVKFLKKLRDNQIKAAMGVQVKVPKAGSAAYVAANASAADKAMGQNLKTRTDEDREQRLNALNTGLTPQQRAAELEKTEKSLGMDSDIEKQYRKDQAELQRLKSEGADKETIDAQRRRVAESRQSWANTGDSRGVAEQAIDSDWLQDAFVTPLDAFKDDIMAAADQMAVVGSQEEAVTKAIYDEISAMNALEQALLNASPEVKEARQKQAEAERLQAEADKAKAELDAVGGDDTQKKLEGILIKERDASLAYAHNIRELGRQESSIGGVNMGSFGRGINRITDYGTHDKQQNRLRNQYTNEMRQYDAQKQELQDKMATYNALKERADSASSAAKTAASGISPQEKAMLEEHERKVADAKSRANSLVEKALKFDPSSGEQVQPLPKGYMTSPLNVLPSPASIDPLSRGTGNSDATTAMIEQLIGIRKNTEGKVGMVIESLT